MGTPFVQAMHNFDPNTADLSWLSRLASSLLRENHAADDLVQDTLVASLGREIPSGPGRRPWLASVAKRLAARRLRADERRARREARWAAGRPAALPDSSELVAQVEVAERLSAAARELPEPFRRTILLRFYEGLSSEEIARREGRPADTVRARVRRGLALLRRDLADQEGGESSLRALLLPLASLYRTPGRAAAGASLFFAIPAAFSWIMETKLFVTGGVVTLLCGAGFWMTRQAPSGPSLDADAAPPPAALASSAVSDDARVAELPEHLEDRRSVKEAPAQVRRNADDSVFGRVIDERGDAVRNATVYLIRSDAASDPKVPISSRTKSGAQGFFRFTRDALAGTRVDALDLGVVANGFLSEVVADVDIRSETADTREPILVVMRAGRTLRGRVVDEAGRGVPGLRLLAHTKGARVDHVSPTQSLLRAERAHYARPERALRAGACADRPERRRDLPRAAER